MTLEFFHEVHLYSWWIFQASISRQKVNFEDEFPIPMVRLVSSLEGTYSWHIFAYMEHMGTVYFSADAIGIFF